jgi:hypothetical protein
LTKEIAGKVKKIASRAKEFQGEPKKFEWPTKGVLPREPREISEGVRFDK